MCREFGPGWMFQLSISCLCALHPPSGLGEDDTHRGKRTMAVPGLNLSRVKWKVSISVTRPARRQALHSPGQKDLDGMLDQTPCTRWRIPCKRNAHSQRRPCSSSNHAIADNSEECTNACCVCACMPLQDHNDVQSFSARPQLRLQDFGYINVERNGGAVTTRCKKKGGGWATPENVPPELQAEFLRLRLVKTPVLPVMIPFMINQTHRVLSVGLTEYHKLSSIIFPLLERFVLCLQISSGSETGFIRLT